MGPLPFAFSAISLFALASMRLLSYSYARLLDRRDETRTSFLLLSECDLILIQLLLLLLGRL